ncbi:MAG: LysM peptidoglycan-binding domain-containing protein [Bacteroidales bacterium]|nr:LysM peptidoglycan-binding domain-containing protein [Bacteroidales bacterium]
MIRKLIKIWILFGLFLVLPMVGHAQVVEVEKSTEIVTISSKQYYMHHVKKGQTLYGIAKAYQVTEEDIKRLNPEINELGLQANMVIGIPVVVEHEEQPLVEPVEQPEEKPVMIPVATPEEDLEEVLEDTLKTPKPTKISDLPISDDDEFGDGYVIHTVKEGEKTKRLLRRWGVSEEDFRKLNPSVGSRVFVGQKVLIPVEVMPETQIEDNQESNIQVPDTIKVIVEENPVVDTVVEDEDLSGVFELPEEKPDECYASPDNATRSYHVALLVPLYLNEIDRLDLSKAKIEKTKHSRAMKFLQFYEGFMMAVDSLTRYYGLQLDLTVMDVSENVAGAQAAVSAMEKEQIDLIIGPFFSKSFAVVEEFALSRDILIVNPMSERESILENAPNVVKLKPSASAMADELGDLIRIRYPKAKVTLLATGSAKDSVKVAMIEEALLKAVEPEVRLTNDEMLDLITKESARRKMGKRVLSTLEVEGQIFSTKSLKEDPNGEVFFDNPFRRITYAETDVFKKGLSSARDNVLVAYGSDIVFATKILNNINRSAKKYPITLIGLPNWSEFDNLLVPNLLNMNAIYMVDNFVDYNDETIQRFVDHFRESYNCDPIDYAFEGYDVAWYFLKALMEFGPHAGECLPYYHPALMHSRYYFNKKRYEDGLENRYWSIYQYDNPSVELKPILIYSEED